ncbi:heterocycloanthracin/sonorensin family bacteriocin [Peribacillus simplex]|uniref:heterocycloanthracin/sonorensin family bacteriocin n=1 Tax=Peribacillus simplex TaxID=1478 RepID=UPI003670BE67
MYEFQNQLQNLNVDDFQVSQPILWDQNQFQQGYSADDSRLIGFGFGCFGCLGCFIGGCGFGRCGGCGGCFRCGGCGGCGRCGGCGGRCGRCGG